MKDLTSGDSGVAMLSESVNAGLCNLFSEYNNKLWPLIAAIEAQTGDFPGLVLNEIRACFSHVARCCFSTTTEEDAKKQLRKARVHILRATLDCYKILLLCHFDRYRAFRKQYTVDELKFVDNGHFLPELEQLNNIAEHKSYEARRKEALSFPEKEHAYGIYNEALSAYQDIYDFIAKHSEGLANASQLMHRVTKKENRRNWKFAVIGAVLGGVVTLLIAHLTPN